MTRDVRRTAVPSIAERFGIRSATQVARDLRRFASQASTRDRFAFDPTSLGLWRPDLSLPAYAGRIPRDGLAPIFNFFDRTGGGIDYRARVTRRRQIDWRGGRLSYDEHDGTDFVCPPGIPVVAAAPGVVVAFHDDWLRGGLTACVDHGYGVVTQYSHLSRAVAEPGEPVPRDGVVGLSGVAGFDMTQGFPVVPPHVHFMVFVLGRPIDPFRREDERDDAAGWAIRNDPRPGPIEGDPLPPALSDLAIDPRPIERLLVACLDDRIRREIESAPGDAARVALLEDALHHERQAWPEGTGLVRLRPDDCDPSKVRLTLPFGGTLYHGARTADTRWTRPGSVVADR